MDDPEQVAAYAQAGRSEGLMAASYLFHAARISQVIQGCERVLDLGCGPGTQLAQVAALNPRVSFLGVDLSLEMLDSAAEHVRSLGLQNVEFAQGDITRLGNVDSASVDAIVSTMALHHLPTQGHLRACFETMARVLRPGGAVYLTDFIRLKSLKSVLSLAYMNAGNQPHIFCLDFERSLRAAFLLSEFTALARETFSNRLRVYSLALVPALTIVKSEDRPLPSAVSHRLQEMRRALSRNSRRELDDLRLLFWLGGLAHDPFRGGAARGLEAALSSTGKSAGV
jgi:ubiquinone/menaquinone biosynthesis C-methylase UbiE